MDDGVFDDVIFSDLDWNQFLGTISIPKNSNSVVIISHGFSSSKDSKLYVELQDELNSVGIGTFRYDYYGHGKLYCKNEKYSVLKDVTLSKCVSSLKAAISFIKNKGDFEIGLVGSSFGALISLIVASQDESINALVLKSSVTEPIEFWKARLGEDRIKKWKQKRILHYDECGEDFELNFAFWEDLFFYDTYNEAKNIICPTLIIHGGSDLVVPIKQSYELAKILNTKVRVVEGANHDYRSSSQYNKMKSLIINFFKEKL